MGSPPMLQAPTVPVDWVTVCTCVAPLLTMTVTPGPGIFYVLARSLGEGTRVGLRSTLGTGAGGLCHVVGAALGLSTLLMTSATAFEVVRYAGACYLVFLGVRTLLRLREPDETPRAYGAGRRPAVLRAGAATAPRPPARPRHPGPCGPRRPSSPSHAGGRSPSSGPAR